MAPMQKNILAGLLIIAFLGSPAQPARAEYIDEIHAPVEEVWETALQVLKPYGIHKKKEKSHFVETKWAEDTVSRRYGRFMKFKKQSFTRRYKIQMRMSQDYDFVRVQTKLKSEEKPFNSVRDTGWKKSQPDYQEYLLEKEAFMKVVRRIESNRNLEAPQNPPADESAPKQNSGPA